MKTAIKCSAVAMAFTAAVISSGCVSKTAKQTLAEYGQTYERVQALEQIVATADFNLYSGEELDRKSVV